MRRILHSASGTGAVAATPPAPPPEPDAEHPSGYGIAGRIHDALHSYPILGPAVVLLLAIVVFYFTADHFLTAANLSQIVQQVMVVGILGVAQTVIILTAGIDLSVGAIMILSSIVMGKLATDSGLPAPLALLIGLGVGIACGTLNGLLVTRVRLPPFIATLGTYNVFTALMLYYSSSQTISDVPRLFSWTGETFSVGGTLITYGSVMLVVLVAVMAFVLANTAWGKHVYAAGDDAEAARLAGVRTDRVILSVYIVAGLICGLAAWAVIGRTGSASPNSGVDANLDSITAVVIGGTSLFGGRGRVIGTLIGALTVGVFRNGLALAGVEVLWQTFAVGVLVIVAVAVDRWIRQVKV
jgi:fructose transport system permease protein